MLYEFAYAAPGTRKELVRILSENQGNTRLLAGGTDILVAIRDGLVRPGMVVDLKRIKGLNRLTFSQKDGLAVGAGVTINELKANRTVRARFPVLVDGSEHFASHQLRNRATVVGNICNASPSADLAPPLLALDASVVLTSVRGSRTVPVSEFFKWVKQTNLEQDEFCERIVIPAGMADARGGYKRLTRIKGHDLALVSVALLRKNRKLRVAVGAAAPTPVLVGELPSSSTPAKVWAATRKAISPIDDVRCSKDYRLFMAEEFVKELMKEAR